MRIKIGIAVSLGTGVALAVACGGTTSNENSEDGGPGSSGSSGGSSGSSGGSGSSSGGVGSPEGGPVVQGGPVPCGAAVCNPPEVCCNEMACVASASACGADGGGGVVIACTADTCPSGSLCCASVTGGFRGGTASTQCQQGGCGTSETQLCSMTVPCPAGERCRGFGGGGISLCEPGRDGGGFDGGGRRDGGGRFDAGFPPPMDATVGPPPDSSTPPQEAGGD